MSAVATRARRAVPIADVVARERRRIDKMCGTSGSSGYVYVIRQVGGDLMKIGRAANPESRIADIQRMNGSDLELVGLCHEADLERFLHAEHSAVRVHGEWFRLSINPIVGTGVSCWGCVRSGRANWLADILDIEVEVPVILSGGGPFTPYAMWATRDGSPIGTDGALSAGAFAFAYARPQRSAAIRMFALSSSRAGKHTGRAFELVNRMLELPPPPGEVDVSGHGNSIYFWPGLWHRTTSDPADVVEQYRNCINELRDHAVLAREDVLRRWDLLP